MADAWLPCENEVKESIAQRSRRSQRRNWGWGERSLADAWLPCENEVKESIAQRARRSQRGIEDWRAEGAFGGRHRFWAGKTRVGGEHRTEVAEVTEGDRGTLWWSSVSVLLTARLIAARDFGD